MPMPRKFFCLLRNRIYLLQNYFSSFVYKGYIQSLERNLKNLICMRVNNFAKSVNF